jgi:hypothetical protein
MIASDIYGRMLPPMHGLSSNLNGSLFEVLDGEHVGRGV